VASASPAQIADTRQELPGSPPWRGRRAETLPSHRLHLSLKGEVGRRSGVEAAG